MTAYLIGVGGTGSRCVEAFVHLAAAGLGPDMVEVALVDQDVSNGNLEEAVQLLDLYKRLHTGIRGNERKAVGSAFLKTQFSFGDKLVWSPLREHQTSLKQHFEYNGLRDEAKLVFDALFSKRFERDQSLNEGFRARPAVGAAAIHSAADHDSYFRNALEALKNAGPIHVVIVGSIFGGTGASGLPNLARIFRRDAEALEIHLQVSAILMLPYFQFEDPKESGENLDVPKSRAFALNTQHALRYYHQLVTQYGREIFDRIYLVGFSPLFKVPYRQPGGNRQTNKPLFPELLSAIASVAAFSQPSIPDGMPTQIWRAGFDEQGIDWGNLPDLAVDGGRLSLRDHLGQFLRFALAYLSAFRSDLMPENHARFSSQIWYKMLIDQAGVNLSDRKIQSVLQDLEVYCKTFVSWCYEVSQILDDSYPRINLFSIDPLVKNGGDGLELDTELLSQLGRDVKSTFKTAVTPSESCGLDEVFLALCQARAQGERGLWAFSRSLYESCKVD